MVGAPHLPPPTESYYDPRQDDFSGLTAAAASGGESAVASTSSSSSAAMAAGAYNGYGDGQQQQQQPSGSYGYPPPHSAPPPPPTFAFDPYPTAPGEPSTSSTMPSYTAYGQMSSANAAGPMASSSATYYTPYESYGQQQQQPLSRLSISTSVSGADGGVDPRASFSSSSASGGNGEFGGGGEQQQQISYAGRTMAPWSAYSGPGANYAQSAVGPGPLPLRTAGAAAAAGIPLRQRRRGGWSMQVKQQPERARLCSFKEENDTIDRRPVDPPPIVQIYADYPSASEILEDTHLFVRVNLVARLSSSDPSTIPADHDPSVPYYPEVRLPQGIAATTGESLQTPEKLLDLEGNEGVFCVFGKLSIRMPGVFRLRFVVYNTIDSVFPGDGVEELASCVSEPFEVFSPKLFNGMKPSTVLTRHFASQGFKIKLRQSSAYGKSTAKKRKKEDAPSATTALGSNKADGSGSSSKSRRRTSDFAGNISGEPFQTSPVSAVHATFGGGNVSPTGRYDAAAAFRPMFRPQSDFQSAPFLDTGQPPPPLVSTLPSVVGASKAPAQSGAISLPPIAAAVEQSSVWFRRAGLIDDGPSDAAGHEGGREFRDGIRYGGDDGFMPPMTFGKLPNMIYEGLLPSTPGPSMYPPTDLSGFSLKINGGGPAINQASLSLAKGDSALASTSAVRPLPPPVTITTHDEHRRPSISALRSGRADSEDSSSPGVNRSRLSLPPDPTVSAAYRFSSALVSKRSSIDAPFELKLPRRTSKTDSNGSQQSDEKPVEGAVPPLYQANDTIERPMDTDRAAAVTWA